MTTPTPSLSSLLSKITLDDHAARLSAAETALKSSAHDLSALHVKAVALIKLDRYADAVQVFEAAGNNDLKTKAKLEYAYSLYKVGRLEDAARIAAEVSGGSSRGRGARHVEAQARYRLENYEGTAKVYKEIRDGGDATGEEADLRINQGAIDAQGQWLGLMDASEVKKLGREDLEAFETAYNAACGSVARSELAQAEVLLKRAKELCRHSEDLMEDQKVEELLPITVQHLYVLLRLGKTDEAESVAQEIAVEKIPDLSTRKIASSNVLLASGQTSNPFTAHKAFNQTPQVPESDKLFTYQSIPLFSNTTAIDLNSFKFNSVIDKAKKKLAKSSSTSMSSETLLTSASHAAAVARNQSGKAAIHHLVDELKTRPDDVGLILTLVQMHVQTGNITSAVEAIETLFHRLEASDQAADCQTIRYHPGLVGVLVSLYRHQGRKSDIKEELAKAAAYWRQKSNSPDSLLRAAGVALLHSTANTDIKAASETFSRLRERQPNDRATTAGYVASQALQDSDSVQALAEKLTPVSQLISNVDADALEARGIPQSSNAIAIAQASSGAEKSRKRTVPTTSDDAEAEGHGKKRVRKSRLPKNHDAASAVKPDPERWLPMRDRSYYRAPKGRKKGRKGDDRTQGGATDESLDVSKQSQAKGGEVVTAAAGGGGAKKKKGKGKK